MGSGSSKKDKPTAAKAPAKTLEELGYEWVDSTTFDFFSVYASQRLLVAILTCFSNLR